MQRNDGIAFTVYSERDAIDRILPFDAIPRVLSAAEWRHIERGIVQQVAGPNLLLGFAVSDDAVGRVGFDPSGARPVGHR